jgi:hypothetical protein
MSKLVRGDQLPSNLRREVLSRYVYRWTSDNPQRDRAWTGIKGAPTMPLISDEQWLRDHAFYVTDRGTLDKKRNKHANPAYLIEDKSTIQTHGSGKKSPAQLDREIAEALGSTSHATKRGALKFHVIGDGEWFPLWKFREMIVDGRVFDEDGSGHYGKLVDGRRMASNVPVDLARFATSESFNRAVPTWATGVVWKSKRAKAASHASKVKYPPGDPKRYPGYAIASGTHGDDAYFRSKDAAIRAAKRLANEKNRRVEVAHISKNQDRQIVEEIYPSRW